jgi:hypothetical protein
MMGLSRMSLCIVLKHKTQHHGIYKNDIQQNGIQQNDTEHNGIFQNDSQHNGIYQNDSQHNGIQQNETQYSNKNITFVIKAFILNMTFCLTIINNTEPKGIQWNDI